MRFSAVRKSREITIEIAEGQDVVYVIREMTGEIAAEYRNGFRTKVSRKDKDNPDILDYRGLYSDLLAKCLFTKDGSAVPQVAIDSWPESLLQELHKIALEINGMADDDEDDEEDDDEKKS